MFSRLIPSQKGELALIAKNKLKLNTCAMGDGFNDDIMLQTADVGLKIYREEHKETSQSLNLPADI